MRSLTAKPRLAALIIAIIGVVLLAVNHRTVVGEHNYYPMLMLFGPVCILVGIVGAIAPGILDQSGIQTGHTSAVNRIVTLVIVAVGLGCGWTLAHFYSGIW
jgi:hypothetical protein